MAVSQRLGLPPSEVRVVAAHDWDVWGAVRAGCRGAYVARTPGPFRFGEPPDVVGPDLASVADAILAADRP